MQQAKVIAGTGRGLSAFNVADGKEVWKFEGGGVSRCTPAVSGNVVWFCSRNGSVYALNAENGTKLWEAATGGPIDGGPAIAGGKLHVTSCDGKIYCFAP